MNEYQQRMADLLSQHGINPADIVYWGYQCGFDAGETLRVYTEQQHVLVSSDDELLASIEAAVGAVLAAELDGVERCSICGTPLIEHVTYTDSGEFTVERACGVCP